MKLFLIIVVLVFTSMGAYLFALDCMMIDDALELQIKVRKYCIKYRRYPSQRDFLNFFDSDLQAGKWIYRINQSQNQASYQYPMTFPIPWAPGKSKVLDFMPVVYANVVLDPCSF